MAVFVFLRRRKVFEQFKQKIAYWVLIAGYLTAALLVFDLMFRLIAGTIGEISMPRLAFFLFMFVVALIDKFRKGW